MNSLFVGSSTERLPAIFELTKKMATTCIKYSPSSPQSDIMTTLTIYLHGMGIENFKSTIEVDEAGNEVLSEKYITLEEFERQFAEEHLIEIEGNDPIPYTVISQENPISDEWVVYVGGFGQGKESYLDELESIAHSGRKIIYTNPTRGIEGENASVEADAPDTILNKSRAIGEILKAVDADKVQFVGHSQGGAVISTYIDEHPEVATQMILLNSAGTMGGDDSRERIIGRFAGDKAAGMITDTSTILGKSGKRAGQSFSKEVFGSYEDIGFRLGKEIPGVAAVDISPMLKKIKERGETEIVLVNANKDGVYPPEAIDEMLGTDAYELVDRHAMFSREKAGHSEAVAGKSGLLVQLLNESSNIVE